MVLISIHPFTYRKILLVVVAFLGLSAFCFADPVLMAQRYTRNSERLDALKTDAPAGPQSQQAGKARSVGPELGKVESSDWVSDEAERRLTELWTNPGLPRAESASGFSLRDIGVRWDLPD